MKPGYKTTEFWLSTAAAVLGALLASDIIPAESVWMKIAGLATTVLASFGYTVARGSAKLGAGK